MAIPETVESVYGPGTYTNTEFIPLSKDCPRLLAYLASVSPGFPKESAALKDVEFVGNDLPILPGPLKAQALVCSQQNAGVGKTLIGTAAKEISAMKGIDVGKIRIDMNQAGMYLASPVLCALDGRRLSEMVADGTLRRLAPYTDLDHDYMFETPIAYRSWAIYPTRDNQTYQLLSNLAPSKYLEAFGLDVHALAKTNEEAYELIKAEIVKYSARELEAKNIELGACGSICRSPASWRETLMGKSLARHPLINYSKHPLGEGLPPIPFPTVKGDNRPLAGIKVVELARVIAGPALGAVLTSLGAEVVKVEPAALPDPNLLQMTLTASKWTCAADLTTDEGRAKLHKLLEGADVVIQAFRRGSLERKGFGLDAVLNMARKRNKGLVYLDLNCFGPDGTYAERPGFQQIADAASGCSYVIGKSYGFPEGTGVLPSLPISDMLTGAFGALDILLALRDRAMYGGCYYANVCLTAVDCMQLSKEFGLYPTETVRELQDTYKYAPMTPDLHGNDLMMVILRSWDAHTDLLTRKQYFTHFSDSPFGKDHAILSPVVQFEDKSVSPHWLHSPVPYCHHKEVKWQS